MFLHVVTDFYYSRTIKVSRDQILKSDSHSDMMMWSLILVLDVCYTCLLKNFLLMWSFYLPFYIQFCVVPFTSTINHLLSHVYHPIQVFLKAPL